MTTKRALVQAVLEFAVVGLVLLYATDSSGFQTAVLVGIGWVAANQAYYAWRFR